MALDKQTNPLEIAQKTLSPETISWIRNQEWCNNWGYSILDRWALNSPDSLLALEAKGETAIMAALYQQQETELSLLKSPEGIKAQDQGQSIWEIFQSHGINTELVVN